MALREKGLEGWDQGSYATQGDDALGGWGGQPTRASQIPPMPTPPSAAVIGNNVSRMGSPAPTSPVAVSPQSPRQWTGGNSGGMIHDAHNSYSGAYGGANLPRTQSFASQAPSHPAQGPQAGFNGGYGNSQSAYQRF